MSKIKIEVKEYDHLHRSLALLSSQNQRSRKTFWTVENLPPGHLKKKTIIVTADPKNKEHIERLMRELRPDAIPHTTVTVVTSKIRGKSGHAIADEYQPGDREKS